MVKKILLVIFLLPAALFSQEKTGSIEGKVYSTDGPLVGANVILFNSTIGAATDENGNYKLENIPFGKYIIKCSYIGFDNQTDTIELTKTNPDIIYDFPYLEFSIPLSDSIKRYRDLFSAMKPDEILKITVDSLASDITLYCTFRNISKYPVYVIEDLEHLQTLFLIVKDQNGMIIDPGAVIRCGNESWNGPDAKNLIKINPSESVHLKSNYKGSGFDLSSPRLTKGKYLVSVQYNCDYDYIPGILINPKNIDYSKYGELITVLSLPIRGTFYSENYLVVEK